MTLRELELRLMIHISVLEDKGCWYKTYSDWSNYTTINGERGNRLVYKIVKGPIEPGYLICHTCDRPGCINPDHLFQGTIEDNRNDAIKKGRWREFKPEDKELKELRILHQWRKVCR